VLMGLTAEKIFGGRGMFTSGEDRLRAGFYKIQGPQAPSHRRGASRFIAAGSGRVMSDEPTSKGGGRKPDFRKFSPGCPNHAAGWHELRKKIAGAARAGDFELARWWPEAIGGKKDFLMKIRASFISSFGGVEGFGGGVL